MLVIGFLIRVREGHLEIYYFPHMASTGLQHESDDDMDEFMEKFKTMKYKNGFNEDTWEEVRSDKLLP